MPIKLSVYIQKHEIVPLLYHTKTSTQNVDDLKKKIPNQKTGQENTIHSSLDIGILSSAMFFIITKSSSNKRKPKHVKLKKTTLHQRKQ